MAITLFSPFKIYLFRSRSLRKNLFIKICCSILDQFIVIRRKTPVLIYSLFLFPFFLNHFGDYLSASRFLPSSCYFVPVFVGIYVFSISCYINLIVCISVRLTNLRMSSLSLPIYSKLPYLCKICFLFLKSLFLTNLYTIPGTIFYYFLDL